VNENQDLMITCKSGITIRMSVADIREAGRNTQGVKLIRLDESDEIAAITQLDETEENPIPEGLEEGATPASAAEPTANSDQAPGEEQTPDEEGDNKDIDNQ